jgi:hypothetical protein
MMSYLNSWLNLTDHLAFFIMLLPQHMMSHLYFSLNFTGHLAFTKEKKKKKKNSTFMSYLQNVRILLYINTDH